MGCACIVALFLFVLVMLGVLFGLLSVVVCVFALSFVGLCFLGCFWILGLCFVCYVAYCEFGGNWAGFRVVLVSGLLSCWSGQGRFPLGFGGWWVIYW